MIHLLWMLFVVMAVVAFWGIVMYIVLGLIALWLGCAIIVGVVRVVDAIRGTSQVSESK